MSHEGVIARTIMLDRQMKDIIRKAPDTVIVNVGAGFDDRFSRVDNGSIRWFDLDLPDSIAARRKAFPERERVTMIAGNALESDWCKPVQDALAGRKAKPVFIAEGLFMYLTLEQIKAKVPEEWVMRILEEGGVTTDFRSVWLLVFWGRLTRGGMILTPMTYHHMMHLPACIDHLSIID
jgi:hypothetical protein